MKRHHFNVDGECIDCSAVIGFPEAWQPCDAPETPAEQDAHRAEREGA